MEFMLDRTKKYYCFAFVLYEDSHDYDYFSILDYITKNWTTYGYIEHSPEKDETKYHTHVLVQFPNKRYITAISKEIGLAENYIQPCNFIPYMRYLIHYDNEDKIHYSPNDVHGPIRLKLIKNIKGSLEEEEQAQFITDYIFKTEGHLTLYNLANFVIINGYYSCFRRNYIFFKDLLLEKNKYI